MYIQLCRGRYRPEQLDTSKPAKGPSASWMDHPKLPAGFEASSLNEAMKDPTAPNVLRVDMQQLIEQLTSKVLGVRPWPALLACAGDRHSDIRMYDARSLTGVA